MKGKKIFLRAVEPTDLDTMYRWENDPENWLVSNTSNPFSKHVLEQYVFAIHDLMKDGQARLVICMNDSKEAVGAIDLFELDMVHRRVGVGILVDKDHRGKGIASEALSIVIDHCFTTLGMHQIFCDVLSENASSMKLFKNNGFKETGVKKEWLFHDGKWKDEHLLQLIKSD
jgi:diamine N-acetyltransferase